jgi:hypothetical protein
VGLNEVVERRPATEGSVPRFTTGLVPLYHLFELLSISSHMSRRPGVVASPIRLGGTQGNSKPARSQGFSSPPPDQRTAIPCPLSPYQVDGGSPRCVAFKCEVRTIGKAKGSPMMGEPQTTRRGTDSASDGYMLCLIGRVGFEPTRSITPTDFKSVASPIPPPPLREHCTPVGQPRASSPAFQEGERTGQL